MGLVVPKPVWLVAALIVVPTIAQASVHELMARNELLYESIRKSFSFDVVEEATEVDVLPMELRNAEGEIYTCSYSNEESDDSIEKEKESATVQKSNVPSKIDKAASLQSKLSALDGKCETLNTGWWSYQWCHRKEVKQFHVDVSKGTIEPEWSLGTYKYSMKSGQATTDDVNEDDDGGGVFDDEEENEDEDEIADDYFENGQRCDETNSNRKTKVHFQCCLDEESQSSQKKKKKKSSGTSLATFKSITENEICSYEVIICTNLVCDDSTFQNHLSDTKSGGSGGTGNSFTKLTREDSALSLLKSLNKGCLLRHEGWWSYEFCYMKQVRQFHVSAGVTDDKGKQVTRIESEFMLGMSPKHLKDVSLKDEKKYIIPPKVDDPNAPSSIQMEYTDGTPCDLVNTPRSTTIEYVCGNVDSITSIIEDRTCHYRMVISSLHLCKHPSFVHRQPPTRSVKCQLKSQVHEEGGVAKEDHNDNPFKSHN